MYYVLYELEVMIICSTNSLYLYYTLSIIYLQLTVSCTRMNLDGSELVKIRLGSTKSNWIEQIPLYNKTL